LVSVRLKHKSLPGLYRPSSMAKNNLVVGKSPGFLENFPMIERMVHISIGGQIS
ncbi:unnamed protein product, partial [Dovyalis caffra]